jgi:hypothetical protein
LDVLRSANSWICNHHTPKQSRLECGFRKARLRLSARWNYISQSELG